MTSDLIITGIGSRSTPRKILREMVAIGEWCLENGVLVRSGHAEGADYAFEQGAEENCIAYLPWSSFGRERKMFGTPVVFDKQPKPIQGLLKDIADTHHPVWSDLTWGIKKIIARNVCQVRGHVGKAIVSKACVYWTFAGNTQGGTVFTRDLASHYSVPCFNMQEYKTAAEIIKNLEKLL